MSVVLSLLLVLAAPREAEVKVGSAIGKLTFKDIRYLPRSLDDFKDRKAFSRPPEVAANLSNPTRVAPGHKAGSAWSGRSRFRKIVIGSIAVLP